MIDLSQKKKNIRKSKSGDKAKQKSIPPFHAFTRQIQMEKQEQPFQKACEALMKEMVQVGSFDAILLFSAEGLALAKHVAREELLQEKRAVELSVLIGKMQKVIRHMSALDPLREILIEDQEGKKLVFRYLHIFEQTAILVFVIPPHRNYRGLANRLSKAITQIAQYENS